MVVDAECGMPLDLGKWDCLWEENADKSGMFSTLTVEGLLIVYLTFSIKSKSFK
jgi:hypothetical protein